MLFRSSSYLSCESNLKNKLVFFGILMNNNNNNNVLENLQISARVYDKILKIARTIADLEGNQDIERKHLLEAISFKKRG